MFKRLKNDCGEMSADIIIIFFVAGFLCLLFTLFSYSIVMTSGAAIQRKINNELNNMSVQISRDAFTEVREKNSASYKENFLSHQSGYEQQFKEAVHNNLPKESEFYIINKDVQLDFSNITDDRVEYKCTMDVEFRLSFFGSPMRILTKDIVIQGVHNFKQGADAQDQVTGSGNQNGSNTLE